MFTASLTVSLALAQMNVFCSHIMGTRDYIRPVAETGGAAMMAVGDLADARIAYEQALLERPRSGMVLFDIAMSSEKAGDLDAAAKEYGDFLAAWKDADPDSAPLTHAHSYLAEHPGRSGGER